VPVGRPERWRRRSPPSRPQRFAWWARQHEGAHDCVLFTLLTNLFIFSMMNHMIKNLNSRPFTQQLDAIRSEFRYTYQDLSEESEGVRSQAWFHKQLNGPALQNAVPVGDDVLFGLANLLRVSEARVRELIAEEWLGVQQRPLSRRAEEINSDLVSLSEENFQLIRQLAGRLPKEDPFDFPDSSTDGESDGPGDQ
jgi:hypothetical protein